MIKRENEEDRPTVLVDGGIDNAEYVGIHTMAGLSQELQSSDIRGNGKMCRCAGIRYDPVTAIGSLQQVCHWALIQIRPGKAL